MRERACHSRLPTMPGSSDLGLSTHASAEAQAAAIADDIAYDAHDIDDGLRAGLLNSIASAIRRFQRDCSKPSITTTPACRTIAKPMS